MSNFSKVLQSAMIRLEATASTQVAKMTIPQLGLHALSELRWFKKNQAAPGAKLRLKALTAPMLRAAEWLKAQEESAMKALQWEDTASFTMDVPVYADPAQLVPVDAGTIDPRDNNDKPSANQASNLADFMSSLKSVLSELAAEPVAAAAPAQKTEAPAAAPAVAPSAPAPEAPVAKQEEAITWPLDMASKSFLRGDKTPEQRSDFGKDKTL